MSQKKYRIETLALHAGQSVDETQSRAVPIHRTSSYVFKSTEHASNLFGLKELGNIYSRLTNPTNDTLEQRITQLEGGAASVAVSSGTAAIFNTIITIAEKGDHIVSANNLYGGTYTQFDAILPKFGITTTFVNPKNPDNFENAIKENTKALYIETIGNPVLDFTDIKKVADIAHKNGLPLIVDATFTTPYLLRAIEHGADIVINSLTKWIGGHGTGLGGIITDAGTFNWAAGKHPLFTEPDANYHGLKWGIDLPETLAPIAFALRFRTVPLRNLGACISPDNSWLFLQGLETLPLRIVKHSQNALEVAKFLKEHPLVEWVRHPGLESDPSYETAKEYLPHGYFGGMVVCGLKGGYDAAVKVVNTIDLFSHVANVGDAKSLIIHSASTTHSQLSPQQQIESGLSPDLIRLSIGIEHIEDIKEALDEAIKNAHK